MSNQLLCQYCIHKEAVTIMVMYTKHMQFVVMFIMKPTLSYIVAIVDSF